MASVKKARRERRLQAPPRGVGWLSRGLPAGTTWDREKASTLLSMPSRRARTWEEREECRVCPSTARTRSASAAAVQMVPREGGLAGVKEEG
jgi:hypothetical protein